MYTTQNNNVICDTCLRSWDKCDCKEKLERTKATIKKLPTYLRFRGKQNEQNQDLLDNLNNENG